MELRYLASLHLLVKLFNLNATTKSIKVFRIDVFSFLLMSYLFLKPQIIHVTKMNSFLGLRINAMKKIVMLTVLLTFLTIPGTSFAASFDCAKAVSTTEKMICSNESISKLDEQLSNVYKKALASAIDTDSLKKEQMIWLKDIQNKCVDSDCLMHAYKERNAKLENYGYGVITPEKAESICGTVTSYINDGTLIDRFEKFQSPNQSEIKAFEEKNGTGIYLSAKYLYQNGTDKKVFLAEYFAGSCASGIIVEEVAEGRHVDRLTANAPHDIEEENKEDMQGWGNSEFLLKINNDLVKVVGNSRSSSFEAKAVYVINSSGYFQKLCTLAKTGNIKYIIKESLNFNLCEQVAKNRSGIKEWRSGLSNIDPYSLSEGGLGQPGIMATRADLDDDGKHELLGLLTYESSAGCGGTLQQVKELSSDGKKILQTKLNTNLENGYGIFSAWGAYMGSSPNDWWFSVKIIEFDGKAYLLGTSEKNSVSIYSFWKNERKMWCDFKLLPQHEVTKLYILRKDEK